MCLNYLNKRHKLDMPPLMGKTHFFYFNGLDVAEKEGFEPPELLHSTVFKTAAFDHSATSPRSSGRYCRDL